MNFSFGGSFIYTKATDMMNEKGILEIPENGNFEYIIDE